MALGAGRKGTLEKVVSYYRDLRPRRMVITGAAGSGKTVLAIELILGLLEGRVADAPVPVRIPAALLDTRRAPESAVADLITGHLRRTYHLSEIAARQLVIESMVLPVLDGLDEIDTVAPPGYASGAAQVIRACNAYLDGRQKAAMVLTCRTGEYEALEHAREWVHDAARVELQPVSLPAARDFLTRRAKEQDRWKPVLEKMGRRSGRPLAKALSTPWRLTLAATVYEQQDNARTYLRDPAELANRRLDAEDKISEHLLGLYIPAAVAAAGGRDPSEVHRWLAVLAGYLSANTASALHLPRVVAGKTLSGTDLVLHELWPLAGPRRTRVLTAGLTAAIWLALAAWEVIHAPREITVGRFVAGAAPAAAAILTIGYTWTAWPRTRVYDVRELVFGPGRLWLLLGLALGLEGGLVDWLVFRFEGPREVRLSGWLAAGCVVGLAIGVNARSGTGPQSAISARDIVRTKLVSGLVSGTVLGLVIGLAVGQIAGLALGIADGLAGGLTAALAFGLAGWRYIALLLCTRRWSSRWLPWRLGRFLDWCYEARLIRRAGIGYQFRHQELQEYLARCPTAPPGHHRALQQHADVASHVT